MNSRSIFKIAVVSCILSLLAVASFAFAIANDTDVVAIGWGLGAGVLLGIFFTATAFSIWSWKTETDRANVADVVRENMNDLRRTVDQSEDLWRHGEEDESMKMLGEFQERSAERQRR